MKEKQKKVNPGLKKKMLQAPLVPKINFLSVIKILSRLDTSPPSFTKWTRGELMEQLQEGMTFRSQRDGSGGLTYAVYNWRSELPPNTTKFLQQH